MYIDSSTHDYKIMNMADRIIRLYDGMVIGGW